MSFLTGQTGMIVLGGLVAATAGGTIVWWLRKRGKQNKGQAPNPDETFRERAQRLLDFGAKDGQDSGTSTQKPNPPNGERTITMSEDQFNRMWGMIEKLVDERTPTKKRPVKEAPESPAEEVKAKAKIENAEAEVDPPLYDPDAEIQKALLIKAEKEIASNQGDRIIIVRPRVYLETESTPQKEKKPTTKPEERKEPPQGYAVNDPRLLGSDEKE